MKLTIRDGYELVQDVKGDGIVNVLARKKDGSEDDAELFQIIDGRFIIPGDDRELGRAAKLVYQVLMPADEKFGVYASEEDVPTEEDFDVINETELGEYVTVDGLSPEDCLPDMGD